MTNQEIITCAFCQGTGKHPHFTGSCPVCKGRGKNEVMRKYMTCSSCRGSGHKRGTTLTCYDCGGAGVVPDTRETFKKAREEIREAQEEITRERSARQRPEPHLPASDREASQAGAMAGGPARNAFSIADAGGEELTEKGVVKITPKSKKHKFLNILERKDKEDGGKTYFCQCCGDKVNESIPIKICLDCFSKVKDLRTHKGT